MINYTMERIAFVWKPCKVQGRHTKDVLAENGMGGYYVVDVTSLLILLCIASVTSTS